MRVLLDTCVLFPTIMREILLGIAARGAFTPLWSARILDEWAHAVARKIPHQAEGARVEIALLRDRWRDAEIPPDAALEEGLFLPDVNDRHVLGAAISGRADCLVTLNLGDFPTRTLAAHDILRRDPDGFLIDLWQDDAALVHGVCNDVRDTASRMAKCDLPLRALLKKARLPRLGKALSEA